MLQELLHIFRPGNPLNELAEAFARMLGLTSRMTATAGTYFDGRPLSPEERSEIYKTDVEVNKLEREIRKLVVTHLSVAANKPNLPYCLVLISLVKDVERIGDYAKNMSEIGDLYSGRLPEDDVLAELHEIRADVEETFAAAGEIIRTSDREGALTRIRRGKADARRCDVLLTRIAKSELSAGATTALVLGTRYYKRIGGHLLNVLSSVVMPLHKVDYYDEDDLQ